jgi:hypothetical protein
MKRFAMLETALESFVASTDNQRWELQTSALGIGVGRGS